jgi:hypothetical protein
LWGYLPYDSFFYDEYDDIDRIMRSIFAAASRRECMRQLIKALNTVKKILPTGTVIFAHRWRPTARTSLRYRSRMRNSENIYTG